MPRNRFGFLITTVLLAVTACASAGAAQTAAAPGKPAPAKPKQPVEILSASFASHSTGWLLAAPQCVNLAKPCAATALMRKTVDGGRTWFAVPAPSARPGYLWQPAPPPDSVGQILFTSAREGWAFGSSLWRTTDGGGSWHRVSVPGPVAQFAVAGNRMLAVIGRCDSAGVCVHRLYAAAVGGAAWRAVPGTATKGTGSPELAVSGTTGYLISTSVDLGKPVLLAGPVTGSARWRALPEPCPGAFSAAIAAVPGYLFEGCGSEPGAGNQLKTAYLSANGGRTWRKVASPPQGGYLGFATMTAGGTIFLSGGRMDVYISRDRGRSWHESPSLLKNAAGLAGAGFSLEAATVTNTFGVAVQDGVFTQQIFITRDAGRTWVAVTVR